MVRYWAHNPGTDNACASPTLAPATNIRDVVQSGRMVALGASGCRFNSCHPDYILIGLSNWLARRPVKPLPAGHVGSSPSPPIEYKFYIPG